VGGFAVIEAGFPRFTQDLDLLMDVSPENEARVFEALRSLPDEAVDQHRPDFAPGCVGLSAVECSAGRWFVFAIPERFRICFRFERRRAVDTTAPSIRNARKRMADVMQRSQRLGKTRL